MKKIFRFAVFFLVFPLSVVGQNARRIVAAGEKLSVYNPLTQTYKEVGDYGRVVDMAVRDSTAFLLTPTSLRTLNLETGATMDLRESLSDARRLALDTDGGVWVTHSGGKIRDYHGVFVVSGGVFGDETDNATVGFFDGQEYTVWGGIDEESIQDAVFEAPYLYVTAQNRVLKYDVNLKKGVAEAALPGCRRLAIAGDYLFCGKWFGATGGYLTVLDKSDLSIVHEFADVDDETNGLAYASGKMFVTVPGGWMSTTGKILEIDLSSMAVSWTLPLGEEGAGVGNFVRFGNDLWTLCGAAGNFLRLNPLTREYELIPVQLEINSYSPTWYVNDSLLAVSTGPGTALFNVRSRNWENTQFLDFSPAAFLSLPEHSTIYATVTDYFSYGKTYVLDATGAKVDSFSVGISPEALAYDPRPVREYLTKFSEKLMPLQSTAAIPEPPTGVAVAGGKVYASFPGYIWTGIGTFRWIDDSGRLFTDGVRVAGAGAGKLAVFDGTTPMVFESGAGLSHGLFIREGTLFAAGPVVANYSLNTGETIAGNWADFAPVAGASVDPNGDYYLVKPDGECIRFSNNGTALDAFGEAIELIAVQYGEAYDDTTVVSRPKSGLAVQPLYPNPCRDQIILPMVTTGEIYDVSGRKMATFEATSVLDTSKLLPGTYALRTPQGRFVFQKAGE